MNGKGDEGVNMENAYEEDMMKNSGGITCFQNSFLGTRKASWNALLKETLVKITLKSEDNKRLQEWVVLYENNLLKA